MIQLHSRILVSLLMIVCLTTPLHAGFIEMFVFGDSLSDTGNVLKQTGDAWLVTNRPANPWYDTGRWTNGESNDGSNTTAPKTKESAYSGVWHERLAAKLKINPATNSLAKGNNWAYGGATTGGGAGSLNLLNIGQQVTNYLGGKPKLNDQQLFAVWGGGNDLRDAAKAKGPPRTASRRPRRPP